MIRAIIFDCFGVVIADALQLARDELQTTDPEAADEVSDLVKAANRGLLDPQESRARIAGLLGLSHEEYVEKIVHGAGKDHKLLDLIAELRKQYKIGLLSNVGRGGLSLRFTPEERATYFDAIVESGDIGYAKPEPEAYETTAERLGVEPSECIFVDDREPFCEAARLTGMQAIHYQSFDQFNNDLERLLQVERGI